MCSTQGWWEAVGAAGLVARLHETLDALLALDPTEMPEADLPGVVRDLVAAGNRLHAAQLDAVSAFDTADVAATTRHRTTKRWLEHRTAASTTQAAGLVSAARAVRDHLPATRDAAASGQLSPAHVSAVTAVVRLVGVQHARAAEPILLELARRADPAAVRRATAELLAHLDPPAADAALQRDYERRGVTLAMAGRLGYLHGVLDAEAVDVLQAALAPLMTPTGPGEDRTTPQRRADALVDLARRALDAGELPDLGSQRPQLSLVVDTGVLAQQTGSATLPWTGAALPAGAVYRWACDATLSPVLARTEGATWVPLAVGRSSRTATPAQVKALRVRDGGCVHPRCSRTPAYCDAHHIIHWADGGSTDLSNLALLCRHHHRTLHSGHWAIHPDPHRPGLLQVHHPDGHCEPAQHTGDRSPPLRPTA
jgi:hypothetical protein